MTEKDVRIIEDTSNISRNQWNNLISQSDTGSIFHRYEWLHSIEHGVNLEPKHVVMEKNRNPVAVWPNFVTKLDLPNAIDNRIFDKYFNVLVSSKPGYGGFVLSSPESEILRSFISMLSNHCGSDIVGHRIITSNLEYLRYSRPLRKNGYVPSLTTCRFKIDLRQELDAIRKAMKSGRRREVRKIEERDIMIEEKSLTDENIHTFYEKYRQVITRVDGTCYPKSFFLMISHTLEDALKLVSITYDGQDLGEILYIIDEKSSKMFPLFPAVTEFNFEFSPVVATHFHMIQWGKNNGLHTFDFGDTLCSFENGIFKFKEEFGGSLVPTLVWEKGFSPMKWNLYRKGRSLYYRYGNSVPENLQQLFSQNN